MADILSDHDIELLLKETKPLPEDYRSKIQIRPKRGIRSENWMFGA